jgi:orotate phosphoribosyltransferase
MSPHSLVTTRTRRARAEPPPYPEASVGADDDPAVDFQFVNYRSLHDLDRAVQRIALQVPPSVERVVGIPRSGVLAAGVLALQLNLPFTDVDGYLAGRLLGTGRRARRTANGSGPRTIVVDDSVLTGRQLAAVRAAIASSGQGPEGADKVLYAAPFVTTTSRHLVDFFGEVVDQPRIFAWNILHHAPLMARACLDIDGVLCHDPTEEDNDDGLRYAAFLRSAQPLFVPTAPRRPSSTWSRRGWSGTAPRRRSGWRSTTSATGS